MGKKKLSVKNGVLIFPVSAGIEDAEGVKQEMVEYLSAVSECILDLSSVEEIDLSIVQLLIAFIKEGYSQGKSVVAKGPLTDDLCSKLTFSDYIVSDQNGSCLFPKITGEGVQVECQ